jgi:hypothetical protein
MKVRFMRGMHLPSEEINPGRPSSHAKETREDADAHRADVIDPHLVVSDVVLLFENWWVYLPSIETWTSPSSEGSRHQAFAG